LAVEARHSGDALEDGARIVVPDDEGSLDLAGFLWLRLRHDGIIADPDETSAAVASSSRRGAILGLA
jgi:hypothetical protein